MSFNHFTQRTQKLEVYAKNGTPLAVKGEIFVDSYTMSEVVRIVLDFNTEMFSEYLREVDESPSLDFVVNRWIEDSHED